MTKVKDIMTGDVITFVTSDSIYNCAKILRGHRISGAPVVDNNGEVIGILSEGDIMRLIESRDININLILPSPLDVLELPVRMKLGLDDLVKSIKTAASANVGDIMTKHVVAVSPEEDVPKAARIMADKNINRLPVMDDGKLIGIITRGDVIGAI